MPSLRRSKRTKRDKHKPEVVTSSFELHYEDVVHKHRVGIVAIFASALVLLAVFVPNAVYQTIAEPEEIGVEVESGIIENSGNVTRVEGDITASGDSYLEFNLNSNRQ